MFRRDYLDKIISIDTQVHKPTLEAVNWVKSVLESFGAEVRFLYNSDKTRATLFAAVGDNSRPGIVFSGHLDTVPADDTFYKQAAFKVLQEGDKLYGRGVCDMKGAVACFLSVLPDIVKSGKTAHLVLTHDEEGIFNAVNQLVTTPDVVQFLQAQKAVIVMEPSNLEPVVAHKGTRLFEVDIVGKSGHSSNPSLCIDAVDAAVESYNHIIGSFRRLSAQYGPANDFIEPYSTVTVGMFNAGEAINTVAADARYTILSRENPGDDYESFFNNVWKDFKTPAELTMRQKLYAYAFKSTCDENFIKSLNTESRIVNFGTEAGFFEKIGLPTVVCGPGNIAQAHTKDEYIYIDQLDRWSRKIVEIVQNS